MDLQDPRSRPKKLTGFPLLRFIIVLLALCVFCGLCSLSQRKSTIRNQGLNLDTSQDQVNQTEANTILANLTHTHEITRSATHTPTVLVSSTFTLEASATNISTKTKTPTLTKTPTNTPQPTNTAIPPTATETVTGCPTGCFESKPGCVIKGNISTKTGEKIYHMPYQRYYAQTVINPEYGERWFCTEEEAIANGWRKSKQ